MAPLNTVSNCVIHRRISHLVQIAVSEKWSRLRKIVRLWSLLMEILNKPRTKFSVEVLVRENNQPGCNRVARSASSPPTLTTISAASASVNIKSRKRNNLNKPMHLNFNNCFSLRLRRSKSSLNLNTPLLNIMLPQ